jgi:CyaY protein
MDEVSFLTRSDECLERGTRWLEDFDPDELDFDCADGVLTLEFADGTRFVLNRQTAAGQMWYAAGAHAWHYDWDEERGGWFDDRDGHELFANLSRTVSDKLGRGLPLPR